MGSAVGSANQRFAVGTGEQETVERVKRVLIIKLSRELMARM